MKPEVKKVITNSIWNSGSFILITLVMLLTTPFVVHKLSLEGYGIYILVTSLIGYYGLIDLGLGEALIKFVSEFKAKDDLEGIGKSINTALIIQFSIGLIASVLLTFFALLIIRVLKVSPGYTEQAKYGIYICSIGFLFTIVSSTFTSTIKGLQRYDITSKIDTTVNIIINLLLVLILALGYGLKECLTIYVICNALMLPVYFVVTCRLLPSWKFRFIIEKQYISSFFSFSFYIFLSKLSNIFSTYIVRFIVAFFLTPVAVTFYVLPSKLVGAIGGVLGGTVNSIFPYSSVLTSKQDVEGIRKTFISGSRVFTALAVPLIFTLIIISKAVLTIWMGPEFASKTWIVLCLIAFSSLIGSLSALPNMIIMGAGNSKLVGRFALISIILYLIFLPPLTKWMGITGTAVALLITSILMITYVIRKTSSFLGIKSKAYIVHVLSPHLFSFLFLLVLFSICNLLPSIPPLASMAIGSVYLVLSFLYLSWKDIFPLKSIYRVYFKPV